MKATFFQRFVAYIIDIVILSIILSIVAFGVDMTKANELSDEMSNVMSSYTSGEITIDEYLSQSTELSYDYQKATTVVNIISLVLTIGYFTAFQYLNKGQTIGKKLMKIKVVEKKKGPSIKSMIIRTFIIDGIISSGLSIGLLYVLSKNAYITTYNVISFVFEAIIIVSALMVLYRKDKKGIHDMIARTEVVSEKGE